MQQQRDSWGDSVRDEILIGYWNAYYYDWDKEREDVKGKVLKEWTELKGYRLVEPHDITFHRQVQGQLRSATIDLVFTTQDHWLPELSKAISTDYKVVWGQLQTEIERDTTSRQVVDWTKFIGHM